MSDTVTEPRYLLSIGNDAKTVKGEKEDYLTGVQYMLPHRKIYSIPWAARLLKAAGINNYNACPWARTCIKDCLDTSGHGVMKQVVTAKAQRTLYMLLEPAQYRMKLISELGDLRDRAARRDMTPCARLNGVTDLGWGWVIDLFPDVQFYDYTKSIARVLANRRSNYHLTFSYDGRLDSMTNAKRAFKAGVNTAVCSRGIRPERWRGRPVLDGDRNDLRFLDPPKHWVWLGAKGKARKSDSVFVQE